MTYPDIVIKVSKEIGLPPEVVDKVYKSYWMFIKQTMQALPLKEELIPQDFSRLRANFNIPSLGKLSCTYDRMMRVKERFKYIKKFRERNDKDKKDKTNVHCSSDNNG